MLQSGCTVFYLISNRNLLLCSELSEHILFFCHGAEPVLVPWDNILRNILLHGCLIAILKMKGPVHAYPFAVSIGFTFACVEIYLIDAQIVHAEGMENIITAILELSDQVTAFQGGYDKICRSLQHI